MKKREKLEWFKNEFNKISDSIQNNDREELSLCDFLRIRNYKLQVNTVALESKIAQTTKEAFELAKKDKIKEAVSKLSELYGVRVAIASAILAMKFPNEYCIIDKKVLRQLNKPDWKKDYSESPEIYEKYLIKMKKLAEAKGKSLREFEMELFEKKYLKSP